MVGEEGSVDAEFRLLRTDEDDEDFVVEGAGAGFLAAFGGDDWGNDGGGGWRCDCSVWGGV